MLKRSSLILVALLILAGAANAQVSDYCKEHVCSQDGQPLSGVKVKRTQNAIQPSTPVEKLETIYVDGWNTLDPIVIGAFLEDAVRAGKFGNYTLEPNRNKAHYILYARTREFFRIESWPSVSTQGLLDKGISIVFSGQRDVRGALQSSISELEEYRVSMELEVKERTQQGEVIVTSAAAPRNFTIERYTPRFGQPLVYLKDADLKPLLETDAEGQPIYPSLFRGRIVKSANLNGSWEAVLMMLGALEARQRPVTSQSQQGEK